MIWKLFNKKYKDVNWSYGIYLLLLIAYSLFGGLMFQYLERDNELAQVKKQTQLYEKTRLHARDKLGHDLLYYFHDHLNVSIVLSKDFIKTLDAYEKSLGIVSYSQFTDQHFEEQLQWNIAGAIYFSITIFTTIGYGDMSCKTSKGQLFTVIYALFGIPLVITIINSLGNGLFYCVKYLWKNYLFKMIVKVKKLLSKDAIDARLLTDVDYENGEESKRKKSSLDKMLDRISLPSGNSSKIEDDEELPIFLAVFILIAWIFLSAFIFTFFENWSIFESSYFFFISLTTIGLGDYVPNHKVACINFFLIILGLSVVSLSFSIIQLQLELIFRQIVKAIDMDFKKKMTSDKVGKASISCEAGVSDIMILEEGQILTKAEKPLVHFTENMPLREKMLFKMMMGEHMKKELSQKINDKAKLKNKSVQTIDNKVTAGIQTDSIKRLTDLSILQAETLDDEDTDEVATNTTTGANKKRGNTYKKMYIYNVDD
uniref:Potassium channel subfamily K member 18 n=1 Tax=Rhabditophanes sp. KR3021 TaxID=114890 RepID=A0AC35U2L0_9BILA